MHESNIALIFATLSVAFLHSLAPDHWLPFVMIGKANKWSHRKLLLVSFVSGIGHVGSSVLLGAIGIALGIVTTMVTVESSRARLAVFLLIGFGIVYALVGLRHARRHHHIDSAALTKKTVTLWTIFALFVLGPCEPLIPLMFLATTHGLPTVLLVTVLFSMVTILMMVAQSLLGFMGIQLIKRDIAERYSHALAGVVIAFTGIFILLIGV
ncbi:MAG: sulfite exporter TauE/SafE family protein [Bacteroidota bacterium]